MKKIALNLLLWILFSLMQCGPVVGTLEYGEEGGPMDTLWLMVPFSLLCFGLVLITTYYAVPQLLMRQKWGSFAALEFILAYIVSFIEQLLVSYIWIEWHIIPDGHSLQWGWMLVNTLCNSLMLFFTLLAVGGWYLFDSGRNDAAKEKRLVDRIENYMAEVRNRLRPEIISKRLKQIAENAIVSPQEAEKDIAILSSELRDSLYSLPSSPTLDQDLERIESDNNVINRFLTSRRYRAARILIFQLSLIGICFGAFFATPDQPQFVERFEGFLVLLGMFEIIAAIDIFVLFRSFRKKRRLGRFIFASSVLTAIIILPILAERINLYVNHPDGNNTLFILTTVLATAASVLMMVFYIAGIGGMLLYSDWLRHTRKLIFLQASTKRLEYANLKKQINPHFLFNVLNNAGILTEFNPIEAREMLLELRRLIDYQFGETEQTTISLIDSIAFIRAYLSLEVTRRDAFRFNVTCDGDPERIVVPSLLFIPFVENAVKYASNKPGGNWVNIKFKIKEKNLIFECENPVEVEIDIKSLPESGRLGVANTIRRLELLYDINFKYRVECRNGIYQVVLEIPLDLDSIVVLSKNALLKN
ncbi:MAG: histidine kinase [Bacteroidales bacterium]|nr:histidine kinase [Bacteroidales bacterium]